MKNSPGKRPAGLVRLTAFSLATLGAAFLSAAAPIPDDCQTGGFAIGCQAWTFKEFSVMEAIEKPRRPGDPPRLVAAANKAHTDLGWKPQYPKLEDIVKTAWAWHQKYPTGDAD